LRRLGLKPGALVRAQEMSYVFPTVAKVKPADVKLTI
jgi:hypothetical protein